MWNDPETRPQMEAITRRASAKAGRTPGVADGYTKKQIAELRVGAEIKADRIISAMAKDDEDLSPDELEAVAVLKAVEAAERLVDDEKGTARAAMKEAIVMVLMPGNAQTKLQAIRTVLDYTKAKPASTTNTNLNAAEDFLAALASKGS
jgi:hypothetical protein